MTIFLAICCMLVGFALGAFVALVLLGAGDGDATSRISGDNQWR